LFLSVLWKGAGVSVDEDEDDDDEEEEVAPRGEYSGFLGYFLHKYNTLSTTENTPKNVDLLFANPPSTPYS
jgi:hypothetical protein